MSNLKTTQIQFPLHYTDGIADRTKSGNIIKNFEFYRSVNRDNLWNDPYHASKRTWRAYHSSCNNKQQNHSVDAEHKHKRDSLLRMKFVESSRGETLSRFRARRLWNERCATSDMYIPIDGVPRRRQDVCSGMTSPIGDLNAVRRTITRTVEHLDAEATFRLESALIDEERRDAARLVEQAKRRAQILNDAKDREIYWNTLESLSGISSRPRTHSVSPTCSDRINQLARPKLRHYATLNNCLDGLDLIHITNPEILEAKSV